jgi:hypothetical protein
MAVAEITLQHPNTGIISNAPVGFSWTTLFFGPIPALVRGDWKWGAIMFGAAVLTAGISWAVFPFIYNKKFIMDQVITGFKITNFNGANESLIGSKLGIDISKVKI